MSSVRPAHGGHLKLASDLVILLLMHKEDLVVRVTPPIISLQHFDIISENETNFVLFVALKLIQKKELYSQPNACLLGFETNMKSLCDILRCCILCGYKMIVYHNLGLLVPALVKCSSDPSLRFLRMFLSALNEVQLHELKDMLTTDEMTQAWMQKEDTPRQLKQIARRSIICAMGRRVMHDASLLGLPVLLQEYIQYEN